MSGRFHFTPDPMAAVCLRDLEVGCRLVYRSKSDWRFAVVSRKSEEKATLIVSSPNGRTYRLTRHLHSRVVIDGCIPVLWYDEEERWKDNIALYDQRW